MCAVRRVVDPACESRPRTGHPGREADLSGCGGAVTACSQFVAGGPHLQTSSNTRLFAQVVHVGSHELPDTSWLSPPARQLPRGAPGESRSLDLPRDSGRCACLGGHPFRAFHHGAQRAHQRAPRIPKTLWPSLRRIVPTLVQPASGNESGPYVLIRTQDAMRCVFVIPGRRLA